MKRCEHNCHLCKKEWLGRCLGNKHHGMDVSLEGDRYENEKKRDWLTEPSGDLPICDEYLYGGSLNHLAEIKEAELLGVTYVDEC